MESILVPTDFSDNAGLALKYAIQVAREFKYKITLAHVYELPLFERFLAEEEVRSVSEEAREALFQKFIQEKVLQGVDELKDVEIEYVFLQGNVISKLAKLNKELEPILIVMGSQGSGSDNWERIWLGGTAQKMIKKLMTPVMIIPPDAPYHDLKKIAYATDYNAEDIELIRELLGFAKRLKADVSAVHVKEPGMDWDQPRIDKLKSSFATELENGTLKFEIVEHDKIADGLNEYVQANDINLLAVLREGHNIFDRFADRSLSLKIALHANIPTLVFK